MRHARQHPGSALAPQSGQALVMSAMMITVFFGMLALVVDLGFVIAQRRQQQNAADAAARGVATMLAKSVGTTSSGTVVYVDQSDALVMARAQTLASGNWIGPNVSRTIGIDYLDCSGNLIRSAVAGATGSAVPSSTCRIRATSASTAGSFFWRAVNPASPNLAASAQSTVRIAPTSTTSEGYWPITRWEDHPNAGNNCLTAPTDPITGMATTPCVFWSNNGGSEDTSIGPFKEKLFPSRKSQCVYYGPTHPTHSNQLITDYDHVRPGDPCGSSSVQQLDMEYWFNYGWGGVVRPGDKIEVTDSGNQGHNYSSQMLAYVNADPDGTNPNWGNYRTVRVGTWKYAERWSNGSDTFVTWTGSGSPDRVTIQNMYCFRFYAYWIQTSEVRGWRVACFDPNGTPGAGGPSGTSNTIQVLD